MNRMMRKLLTRWYLATDSELPEWLRRECEKDEELKALWRKENALTASLANERPAEEDVEVSPFLEGKILRAIDEAQRDPDPSSGKVWSLGPLFTMAGLAACAALAVLFALRSPQPSIDAPETAAAVEETAVREAVTGLASVDFKRVEALASSDWKNPLDAEMENVLVDGKRALNFLADSFVPKRVAEDWGLRDA